MTLNEQQRNDLQALQALASEVSASCPDLREQARQFAKTLLERHQLASLEPDQVYFHRFHGASSSPRTFSGWQHLERPYQSMTLPQLVIHRFDANDQDNADLLGLYGGFYREGPDKDVFDERNEVALAPGAVLEELWAYDFASQYQRRLDTLCRCRSDIGQGRVSGQGTGAQGAGRQPAFQALRASRPGPDRTQ